MALKYHPDSNKERGAVEKSRDIAEAYDVLSDGEILAPLIYKDVVDRI